MAQQQSCGSQEWKTGYVTWTGSNVPQVCGMPVALSVLPSDQRQPRLAVPQIVYNGSFPRLALCSRYGLLCDRR